jgi:hypothetical protein
MVVLEKPRAAQPIVQGAAERLHHADVTPVEALAQLREERLV